MSFFFRVYGWLVRRYLFFRTYGFRIPKDPTRILVTNAIAQFQQSRQSGDRERLGVPKCKRILIIIPFRDRWDLTQKCLVSLQRQIFDPLQLQFAICLVDNGSTQKETLDGLRHWLAEQAPDAVQLIKDSRDFNYSALNNNAFSYCNGEQYDYLLTLNNDVELIDVRSLARLLDFAESKPNLGALGSTLIYPSGTVQHLFVAPGVKIVGAHPLKGIPLDRAHVWYSQPRLVPAVTGALMLIPTLAFHRAGGFDEELATAYQDVDLCLKLQSLGLEIWSLTDLVAKHWESASRKAHPRKAEVDRMYAKWGKTLTHHPLMSPRLSLWSEFPVLSRGEGPYPWNRVVT